MQYVPGHFKERVKEKLQLKFGGFDNWVFKLHYRLTFWLLLLFAVIIVTTEFTEKEISCLHSDPLDSAKQLNHVIDNYCYYLSNTFTVSRHHQHSNFSEASYPGIGPIEGGDELVYSFYYQWVPYFFLFQALCFYAPHFIFITYESGGFCLLLAHTFLHQMVIRKMKNRHKEEDRKDEEDKKAAAVTKENGKEEEEVAKEEDNKLKEEERRKEIEDEEMKMPCYLSERLSFYKCTYYLLIGCELLNAVNLILQVYLTDLLLSQRFLHLGLLDYTNYSKNQVNPLEEIFPKMGKCLYPKYGASGSFQTHDAICVLAVNNVNEKLFLILWYWYLIIAIPTFSMVLVRVLRIVTYPNELVPVFNKVNRRKEKGVVENKMKLMQNISVGEWYFVDNLLDNIGMGWTAKFIKYLLEDVMRSKNEGGNDDKTHKNEEVSAGPEDNVSDSDETTMQLTETSIKNGQAEGTIASIASTSGGVVNPIGINNESTGPPASNLAETNGNITTGSTDTAIVIEDRNDQPGEGSIVPTAETAAERTGYNTESIDVLTSNISKPDEDSAVRLIETTTMTGDGIVRQAESSVAPTARVEDSDLESGSSTKSTDPSTSDISEPKRNSASSNRDATNPKVNVAEVDESVENVRSRRSIISYFFPSIRWFKNDNTVDSSTPSSNKRPSDATDKKEEGASLIDNVIDATEEIDDGSAKASTITKTTEETGVASNEPCQSSIVAPNKIGDAGKRVESIRKGDSPIFVEKNVDFEMIDSPSKVDGIETSQGTNPNPTRMNTIPVLTSTREKKHLIGQQIPSETGKELSTNIFEQVNRTTWHSMPLDSNVVEPARSICPSTTPIIDQLRDRRSKPPAQNEITSATMIDQPVESTSSIASPAPPVDLVGSITPLTTPSHGTDQQGDRRTNPPAQDENTTAAIIDQPVESTSSVARPLTTVDSAGSITPSATPIDQPGVSSNPPTINETTLEASIAEPIESTSDPKGGENFTIVTTATTVDSARSITPSTSPIDEPGVSSNPPTINETTLEVSIAEPIESSSAPKRGENYNIVALVEDSSVPRGTSAKNRGKPNRNIEIKIQIQMPADSNDEETPRIADGSKSMNQVQETSTQFESGPSVVAASNGNSSDSEGSRYEDAYE